MDRLILDKLKYKPHEYITCLMKINDEKIFIFCYLIKQYLSNNSLTGKKINIEILQKELKNMGINNKLNIFAIKKSIVEFEKMNIIDIYSSIKFSKTFSYAIKKEVLKIYNDCMFLTFVN